MKRKFIVWLGVLLFLCACSNSGRSYSYTQSEGSALLEQAVEVSGQAQNYAWDMSEKTTSDDNESTLLQTGLVQIDGKARYMFEKNNLNLDVTYVLSKEDESVDYQIVTEPSVRTDAKIDTIINHAQSDEYFESNLFEEWLDYYDTYIPYMKESVSNNQLSLEVTDLEGFSEAYGKECKSYLAVFDFNEQKQFQTISVKAQFLEDGKSENYSCIMQYEDYDQAKWQWELIEEYRLLSISENTTVSVDLDERSE
jgi:hypothetical protein